MFNVTATTRSWKRLQVVSITFFDNDESAEELAVRDAQYIL